MTPAAVAHAVAAAVGVSIADLRAGRSGAAHYAHQLAVLLAYRFCKRTTTAEIARAFCHPDPRTVNSIVATVERAVERDPDLAATLLALAGAIRDQSLATTALAERDGIANAALALQVA